MKKLLILLLISGAVYSQKVAGKDDINKFLYKKWTVDYAMMNGLKVEKLGAMKNLTYSFKSDNSYIANGNVPGKWKYNSKKKTIDLFLNDKINSTVTSLENKKMTMLLIPDGGLRNTAKTIEIHFKSKS